jgi:Ca-activated chloride channel family protein
MALDAPSYLWLLLIVPVFVCASLFSVRRVVDWHKIFARVRRGRLGLYLQTALLGLALSVVSVALAKPKMQYERRVFNRSGIDVVVGIDVSKSMLAEDAPLPAEADEVFRIANRVNRARRFALDILSQLRGERIGVFLFASKGIEVVPFTRDYGFCRYVLTYINDAEITVPGSDLGEALQTGISMCEEDGTHAARILVLLSDGEDIRPEPSFFSESAMVAANKGIRVFTVGIGSGKGVLIPVRSEDGTKIVNHYVDEQGDHLKTRLEQGPLRTIAEITGGEYFSAAEPNGAYALMKSVLKEARDVDYTQATEAAWMELAPFLFLLGFALFGWGMWVCR